MKRRVLSVTLALLLAVAGTGAVLAYINGANGRAIAGLKAVTVLVAQREIPVGTSVGAAQQAGLLRAETLPARSVSPDAVSSVTADLSPMVVSSDVSPGQVLLRTTLVSAAEMSGGLAIPGSMLAVTIPLCLPQAVAGYVHTGSQVAVFDTVASKSIGSQQSCSQMGQSQLSGTVTTRMVLPRVQVLSVGSGSAGGSQGGSTSGTSAGSQLQGGVLVTLAVDQADAERVIQITEAGLPYLALLTPDSKTRFDTGSQPLFR